jgi:hypothetical protein
MKSVMTLLFAIVALFRSDPAASPTFVSAASDQQPTLSEKDARTPAQQKINSQLLNEIYRRRGQAKEKNVPPGPTGVRLDDKERALVDVRAEVVPALEKKLHKLGSTIVSTSREYRSIIAWVPVLKIEQIAADSSVRAVEPAPEATTHK